MDTKLTERQLEYIWHIKDFDSARKTKIIMGEMPDYELYLAAKQKLHNRKTPYEYSFMNIEPLLSREQEQHLFRQYNYLKYKYKQSTEEEIKTILDKIKVVRDILTYANTRLVITVLKKQKYIDFEIALSDGIYGLVDAIDLFDFRKGIKFSTYAYWAIMSKIRTFSQIELGEKIHITSNQDIALEDSPDEECNDVEHNENCRIVDDILSTLAEREKMIITYYYGLKNVRRLGLREISKRFKISKERVRQIKDAGLHKLKLTELRKYEEKRLSLHT
jgi:RNA polymerase sigma factor (sigma-70 family)